MPLRSAVVAALASLGLAGIAAAHEIVVLPSTTTVGVRQSLPFAVHSTHVMVQPEEMEALANVSAFVVAGGAASPVALEAAGTHLAGAVEAPGAAPFWLVAHRHGMVWSETPEGWKEGGRDVHADAVSARKFEKFAKTLVNAGGPGFDAPLGHLLEIVPLVDPGALKAGEELPMKVLLDGAPVAATVKATFAGFSDRPETWAFLTDTLADDPRGPVAILKPWAPGLWVARVQQEAPGGEGFDSHVLRATLAFEVR